MDNTTLYEATKDGVRQWVGFKDQCWNHIHLNQSKTVDEAIANNGWAIEMVQSEIPQPKTITATQRLKDLEDEYKGRKHLGMGIDEDEYQYQALMLQEEIQSEVN